MGHEKRAQFERRLERIRHFERMLVAEGAVLLKLWFHLSKKAQKKRLKELSSAQEDRVARGRAATGSTSGTTTSSSTCASDALRETSTGEAPWNVIEGSDHEYRSLTAGRAARGRAREPPGRQAPRGRPCRARSRRPRSTGARCSSPSTTSAACERKDYGARLLKLQAHLNLLTRSKKMREPLPGHGVRGHGRRRQGRRHPPHHPGAGRALLSRHPGRRADRRGARAALPVALLAPHPAARARRPSSTARGTAACWSSASRASAREADWMRAYGEINDFEEQLTEAGAIVAKFWLADQPGRAAAPLQGARGDGVQALQDHRRGLAQPQEVAAVRARRVRHDRPHLHGPGAVDVVASDDKLFARIDALEHLIARVEASL